MLPDESVESPRLLWISTPKRTRNAVQSNGERAWLWSGAPCHPVRTMAFSPRLHLVLKSSIQISPEVALQLPLPVRGIDACHPIRLICISRNSI